MDDPRTYRPRAGEIPTQPGVYRFRDATRRVIYVGKAKNLRARLSNYFGPLESLHERTRRMVTTATSVEWTVVGTEFEALQLEFTWIKEFNPPFNVQFRDDKSYPYLAVTMSDEVPRAMITRQKKSSGTRYFGPYTKVWAIRETMDLMLKVFPMRSCSDAVYKRAQRTGRPCLLGDIGKCVAPCVGRVTLDEHRKVAEDFVSFLAGNDRRFVVELREKMSAAAAAQEYELAARYRDQIDALETVLKKSAVVLSDNVDADILGIAHDELAAAVQLFAVRGGRIRGVHGWVVDLELDVDLGDLVETVIHNAYDDEHVPAREIIVPTMPEDVGDLERWLTQRRSSAVDPSTGRTGLPGRVSLHVARRGEKAALARTTAMNAHNALALYKTRRSADFVARTQALEDIRDALGMAEAPLRMECYDVSHLAGTNIVASMVVFEDGLARKDQYRRFSIPSSTDDTQSIYQVITRRLAYLRPDGATAEAEQESDEAPEGESSRKTKKFSYPPQLLIVDGGQPQVAAAQRALTESGVAGIQLCGIAKRLEEVWLPDSDYPVILPRNSDALFLIQRIRDEAHRFAITYQKNRRRRDITTVLHDIPGLGPVRVKELLRHFGSVAELRRATADDIAGVHGIGPARAQEIYTHLRSS